MDLFKLFKEKITGKNISVVFPEGNDERILSAAVRLKADNLLNPVLLGNKAEIENKAAELSLSLEDLSILDPQNYEAFDDMVEAFLERRKGKETREQAEELLKTVSYFGTMLVYMNKVDIMVSGAVHSTAETVRSALQIVKTKPGISRISGAFIMQKGDERYIFADSAISINPTDKELAEVAVLSAETAKMAGLEPKVGMLSFSTKGSANSEEVQKVQRATKIAQEMAPELDIDGEFQFDAAFVPAVGQSKAKGSKVAGHVNVFVFPELQSGNIGYKIAQRMGGYEAVGPILQGLNQPISDLSRGANEEDVYKTAILTAAQSL